MFCFFTFTVVSFIFLYSASEAREAFDVDKLIGKEKCLPAIWHVSFDEYSNKMKKKSYWVEVTDSFVAEMLLILRQMFWKQLKDD